MEFFTLDVNTISFKPIADDAVRMSHQGSSIKLIFKAVAIVKETTDHLYLKLSKRDFIHLHALSEHCIHVASSNSSEWFPKTNTHIEDMWVSNIVLEKDSKILRVMNKQDTKIEKNTIYDITIKLSGLKISPKSFYLNWCVKKVAPVPVSCLFDDEKEESDDEYPEPSNEEIDELIEDMFSKGTTVVDKLVDKRKDIINDLENLQNSLNALRFSTNKSDLHSTLNFLQSIVDKYTENE